MKKTTITLLDLAGKLFSTKHSSGINLSVYIAGDSNGDLGLFKVEGLAYRGDPKLPNRAGRGFYSLAQDTAVILDAMRSKLPSEREIPLDDDHVTSFDGQSALRWVYAAPVILENKVVAVVCATGSSANFADTLFKKDIEESIHVITESLSDMASFYDFSVLAK